MICRSCGGLYFRNNKQRICLDCYTNGERKERMFYTVKEWNKFTWDIQTQLSTQYEVILTNHFTLKEKLKRFFSRRSPEVRKRNKEKIQRGVSKFKKLLDQFSKGMNQLHFEGGSDANMNKITGGLNKASGVDHNFDVLTGGAPKQTKKGRSYYGKIYYKEIKKRKKIKNSDPYSALSGGGNDRDFSL